MSGRYLTIEQRFSARVEKTDGCWEWRGWRNRNGYGILTSGPRGARHKLAAHRVSWTIVNGPIPTGLFVCHHCDNRGCVRPDHLFLGTNDDNMADMAAKGRARTGRLSADEVRAIRSSTEDQRTVAIRYGMSPSNVSRIRSRDTYRKVA